MMAKKLRERLKKRGFSPSEELVKEVVERLEDLKTEVKAEAYRIYQGKRRFPAIVVNPYTENSFWNWEKNYVNIGLLYFPVKANTVVDLNSFIRALLYHELSHVENTPIPKRWKRAIFTVFNILEDQRIETLISQRTERKIFEKTHQLAYEVFYRGKKEVHLNPYNLIILRRWSRWGVETDLEEYLPKATGKLKKALDEGYLKDVDRTLVAMEEASAEEAIEITETFFHRWEWLLTEEETANVIDPFGGAGEVNGESSLSPEAKEEIERQLKTEENDFPNEDFTKESPTTGGFYSEKIFEVYYPTTEAERIRKAIRKILKAEIERKARKWIGKKIDPRIVIAGIPKPPAVGKEKIKKLLKKKLLVVIDGSGSMHGEAFQNAVNIAYALKKEIPQTQILITGTAEPITVSGKKFPFPASGTENIRSVPYLKGKLFVFITDGFLTPEDKNFLMELKKKTKTIGIYVGPYLKEEIAKMFSEFYGGKNLNEFIKRLF
jgi:hypothetical protein